MRLVFQFSVIVALILPASFAIAQDVSTESDDLKDISWSPDGTQIAGVHNDSNITIWLVEDLSQPALTFQTELADTIDWTPDSRYLVVQGTMLQDDSLLQKVVTKWDARTGEMVDTLMSFQLDTHFDFNPYGYIIFPVLTLDSTHTRAAFSFRNGKVYLSDGIQVLHLENDTATNNVRRMEWSPDGHHLAIVYGSSDIYSIQIFNVESGELIQHIYQDLQYYVTDLDWAVNGNYIATSSMRYTCCEGWSNIGVYSIENDAIINSKADRWWEEVAHYVAPIDWHPGESILAIATTDTIEIYNPFVEEALYTIAVNEVKDIEWSPDGTRIAGILSDGTLEVWRFSLQLELDNNR